MVSLLCRNACHLSMDHSARCILGLVLLLACSTPLEAANRVTAVYGEASSAKYNQAKIVLKQEKVLEWFASGLEENGFAASLTVASAQCGKPSANYSSQTKTITICYELLEMINDKVEKDYEYPRDHLKMYNTVHGALFFILWHEWGHAVIDLFGLKPTGREEDVADQIAAFFMLEASAEPRMRSAAFDIAMVDAVLWFFESFKNTVSESSFSDEHSLNQQRYYNIICWAYGKDSTRYGYLEGRLSRERARRCRDEYIQMSESIPALSRQNTQKVAPGSGTQSSPPAASSPPPFQPQANQIYYHPVYSGLSISVDFRMILVNGLPPPRDGMPYPILLASLPENEWVQLGKADRLPLPIMVMRRGFDLMVQWTP